MNQLLPVFTDHRCTDKIMFSQCVNLFSWFPGHDCGTEERCSSRLLTCMCHLVTVSTFSPRLHWLVGMLIQQPCSVSHADIPANYDLVSVLDSLPFLLIPDTDLSCSCSFVVCHCSDYLIDPTDHAAFSPCLSASARQHSCHAQVCSTFLLNFHTKDKLLFFISRLLFLQFAPVYVRNVTSAFMVLYLLCCFLFLECWSSLFFLCWPALLLCYKDGLLFTHSSSFALNLAAIV